MRGPYAVVRHPMYAAYLLLQSGYLLQSLPSATRPSYYSGRSATPAGHWPRNACSRTTRTTWPIVVTSAGE
jgi:protein-S-isoprenylcysteine O-methyltransferase Ste14